MNDIEKWRRFRKMAQNMSYLITMSPYDNPNRASGQAECELCGLEYYDHPEVKYTVVRTCDGRLWKL